VLGPSWNRFKGFSASWRNRTIDLFDMLKILDLKRAKELESSIQHLKEEFENVYPETKDTNHTSQPQPQPGSKRKAQQGVAGSAKKARPGNQAPSLNQTPKKPLVKKQSAMQKAHEVYHARQKQNEKELQEAVNAERWLNRSQDRLREKASKLHDEKRRKAKKINAAQRLVREIFGVGQELVGAKHVSRTEKGHREISEALDLVNIRFKVDKLPSGAIKIILNYSLLSKGLGGMRREFQTPEKRDAISKFNQQLLSEDEGESSDEELYSGPKEWWDEPDLEDEEDEKGMAISHLNTKGHLTKGNPQKPQCANFLEN
jgi:hypothetical protein